MTNDVRTMRHRVLAIAVAVTLFAPATTYAQGRGYGRVSGSIEQLYDSNLFAVPESQQPSADWVTRFGPLFEAGYESDPLNLKARYGFDAERHRDLVELDNTFARQNAGTTLNYRGRTFATQLDAEFSTTQSPSDLNLETLRFVGQARAQRIGSLEAFTFDLSPVTSLKVDHGFTRDSLVGGVTSVANAGRLGFARKLNERTTVRADYRPGMIEFSNGNEERHHVGTVGLVHAFTPVLDIEIDGGMRSTSGDIDPEVSAVMRHRMRQGAVAVRYAQTRETTLGEGASLEIRRVAAEITYTPTRAIAFTVSPARASSGGELSHDVVYLLDLQSRIRATRRWSIVAFGRVGQQERRLSTNDLINSTSDLINYRSVSLKTVVTLGALEREREDAETESR
jgi:hypothetical protein